MSDKTIGFIGGGRLVSDCNAESFAKLSARFPGVLTTVDSRAAAAQDIVFLI